MFNARIQRACEYGKMMLGSQSATSVIKSGDAAFEMDRLKPRGMTLADIPDIMVEQLQALAKK